MRNFTKVEKILFRVLYFALAMLVAGFIVMVMHSANIALPGINLVTIAIVLLFGGIGLGTLVAFVGMLYGAK